MNIYTQEIMTLLGVDQRTALEIQERLELDLDLSECTTEEFNRVARLTYKRLYS